MTNQEVTISMLKAACRVLRLTVGDKTPNQLAGMLLGRAGKTSQAQRVHLLRVHPDIFGLVDRLYIRSAK